MILTFVGNLKEMDSKDLIDIIQTNEVNPINKNEILVELMLRHKKQNPNISFSDFLREIAKK